MSLFCMGAFQSVARWLELLALGVYVFDKTQSPFLVALITLLRVAPLALFGPLFGAFNQRIARRKLYLIGLTLIIFVSLTMAWLSWADLAPVWLLCVVSFAGGLFWVLDFPVRRTLLGEAVPAASLGRAMGFDTVANNGTRMLGPLLGGAFLDLVGLYGAFLVSAAFYIACFIAALTLKIGTTVTVSKPTSVMADIRLGLVTVNRDPLLKALLLVTVVYNLFGFPTLSMVPVIGRDELQISASLIGLVAAMEGMGAILAGLMIIFFAQIRRFRQIYVFGLALSLAFCAVYASAGAATPMGLALLIVGVGASGFSAMQTTLLILNSDKADRSRVMGLLSVCIGSALIGFAWLGLAANWIGPRMAVIASAVIGLLSLLAIWMKWRDVIAPQPTPTQP